MTTADNAIRARMCEADGLYFARYFFKQRTGGGKAKGDGAHSKAATMVRNGKVEAFLASVQHEAISPVTNDNG